MVVKKTRRRSFGEISEIRSTVPGRASRWRARYWGEDARRYTAPSTFAFRGDAEGFLRAVERDMHLGLWTPPEPRTRRPAPVRPLTFDGYAEQSIQQRSSRTRRPIRPSTVALYRKLLRLELSPAFGTMPLGDITAAVVKAWHLDSTAKGHPTQTANAYLFAKSVFTDAVDEGLVASNPCRVKGAGKPERAREVEALSVAEVGAYLAAVPEHYRAALMIAVWCGLRSGEVRGLRVRDIDTDTGILHIRQAVARIDGTVWLAAPKTTAGVRDVVVPPHVRPLLKAWLAGLPVRGRDALVFPAGDGVSAMNASTLRDAHTKGATAIGRPTLTVHDLRRTAATLAAQQGATMSEVMRLLGHTTTTVAALYQVADTARLAHIADQLSQAATHN